MMSMEKIHRQSVMDPIDEKQEDLGENDSDTEPFIPSQMQGQPPPMQPPMQPPPMQAPPHMQQYPPPYWGYPVQYHPPPQMGYPPNMYPQ